MRAASKCFQFRSPEFTPGRVQLCGFGQTHRRPRLHPAAAPRMFLAALGVRASPTPRPWPHEPAVHLRGSALARTSPGRGADLCYEGTRCPLSPSGSLAGLATKSTEDRRTGGKPRSATGGSPPGQVQPFVAGVQGHPTERTLTLLLEEALSRPRCSSVYF